MPNSQGEPVHVACPSCRRHASYTLWTTIDIAERPDLEQAILADRLRVGACPHCAAAVPLPSAPLLMYRPDRVPPLVLAFRPEDEGDLVELMKRLMVPLRHVPRIWDGQIATVAWTELGPAARSELDSMTGTPDDLRSLADSVEWFYDEPSTEMKMLVCWAGGEKCLDAALSGRHGAKALARRYLERALTHAENLGLGPGAEPDPLRLHQALAQLHLELAESADDHDQGLDHLRAEADGAPDRSEQQARALGNWGEALMHRPGGDRASDLDEAIDVLSASAEAWAALDNREASARQDLQVVKALSLRAEIETTPSGIHTVPPEQDEILRRCQRAVETLTDLGSDHLWAALLALGSAQAQTIDIQRTREQIYAAALATFRRGIDVTRNHSERRAYFHHNIASLYRQHGELDRAVANYEAALGLANGAPLGLPPEQIQADLGNTLLLRAAAGDHDRVEALLTDAATHHGRAGRDRERRAVLRALADQHFDRERWRDAAVRYQEAWQVDDHLFGGVRTDSGRRAELIGAGRLHARWAYALLRDGHVEDAMIVLERGRTRALRQSAALPAASVLADLHAAVPVDGALVMLLATSAGGAAIILSGETPRLVRLDQFTDARAQHLLQMRARLFPVSDAEYEAHFYSPSFQHSNIIVTPLEDDDMPALQSQLWRLAISRIDDALPPRTPVRLLPGGGLALLPWSVAAPPVNVSDIWLARRQISIAPSAFALRVAHAAPSRAGSGLLVVADPTGDLPSARAEAALIAGPSTPLLIGAQATPAAFRTALTRHRPLVLHLACHAYYDWDDPTGSHLRLHGGAIGMDEMRDALAGGGVETVILSACDTGVATAGPIADELVGWPALFMRAGVTAVVSTLWPVHDVVAAVLTADLHRRLAAGDSPASALRGAQLWLCQAGRDEVLARLTGDSDAVVALRDEIRAEWTRPVPFDDPAHWAAFVLTS
ncbi:CHAT domain-containing protein [Micromonospora sp. NPDC048839]|uniref:CHAT domain-containing protein n=1 Tax=Micromonospora sp. NPDC048839 TaxID=3155641 RepID=UPI0033E0BE89